MPGIYLTFNNIGMDHRWSMLHACTLVSIGFNLILIMLHILLLNRCVVINHVDICLDLNIFRKTYFMC
jgi:hypothetical protein